MPLDLVTTRTAILPRTGRREDRGDIPAAALDRLADLSIRDAAT